MLGCNAPARKINAGAQCGTRDPCKEEAAGMRRSRMCGRFDGDDLSNDGPASAFVLATGEAGKASSRIHEVHGRLWLKRSVAPPTDSRAFYLTSSLRR
eukprot:4965039-Pyramimonas_sp.AAC.1